MIIWKGIFFCFCHQWKLKKRKKKENRGFFFFLAEKDKEGNSKYDYLWKRWERIRFRFRCFESFIKSSTFPYLKVRIDSHCSYRNHHRYSNNHRERDILDFRIENRATIVSSRFQRSLMGEWDRTVCRFMKALSQYV